MIAGWRTSPGGNRHWRAVVNNVPRRRATSPWCSRITRCIPHDRAGQHGILAAAGEGAAGGDRREGGRAAGILGLTPYLARFPRQLSGGQRQRVAMGRAIVRDPQVFLFDEPLSNLDAKLRVQMRAEIKDLHQRLKTTTVYVTHDQIEAMTMADKIVVMNAGNVEQMGRRLICMTVPRICSWPFHRLAGDEFSGWAHRGRGVHVGLGEAPIAAGTPNGERGRDLRHSPEHWRLDDGGVPATVQVVEPTGRRRRCW